VEKVCFQTRGLAGLGGRRGKQTNSGKKKFPAEKQKFPSPGKRLVSGSGNKGFEPEKVCVTTGNKRFRDRPGKIKFRDSSCKFPKLGFFERKCGVSLFPQPPRNTALPAKMQNDDGGQLL
jgi:hypothetical protein